MNGPTSSQRGVLESTARVRLVRAAPGSGKTWLVARVLGEELEEWNDRYGGIAALSFTNVAGEEIRRALGSTPAHPHFVGTIDSFLYRFVVRPFARVVNPKIKMPPRLLAADAATVLGERQRWYRETAIGYTVKRGKSHISGTLYDCHFVGMGEEKQPEFIFDPSWDRIRLTEEENREVFRLKKVVWHSCGRMSHSDVAYIAAAVLASKGPGGEHARTLLARRFSFLVVDELQDTGDFRSRSLLHLLQASAVRALLVGDPDQAIYGFNGADPAVFRKFEQVQGVECFDVQESLRCGTSICHVATALSFSGRSVEAWKQSKSGQTILVAHDDDLRQILQLGSILRRMIPASDGKVALLARKNRDVRRLLGRAQRTLPKFSSPPLESLYRAVQALHDGRMKLAKTNVEACLGRVLLGTESPDKEDLARIGMAYPEWKYGVSRLLFAAAEIKDPDENGFDWGCRMISEVKRVVAERGWASLCDPKWPRRPHQKIQKIPRPSPTPQPEDVEGSLAIQTVHASKGETHHTTLYYVPKSDPSQCPSVRWWSFSEEDGEERRVAFVAASRPKHTFILVVHTETLERLAASRPEFVQAFTLKPLPTFLADLNSPSYAQSFCS